MSSSPLIQSESKHHHPALTENGDNHTKLEKKQRYHSSYSMLWSSCRVLEFSCTLSSVLHTATCQLIQNPFIDEKTGNQRGLWCGLDYAHIATSTTRIQVRGFCLQTKLLSGDHVMVSLQNAANLEMLSPRNNAKQCPRVSEFIYKTTSSSQPLYISVKKTKWLLGQLAT